MANIDSRVRTVLAGYRGELAAHVVSNLGESALDDPGIRELVTAFCAWYDTPGIPSAGSVKDLIGRQLWDAVNVLSRKEGTMATYDEDLAPGYLGLGDADEWYDDPADEDLEEAAPSDHEDGTLKIGGRVINPQPIAPNTGIPGTSNLDARSLIDLVRSSTHGKGHDMLMDALGLSERPESDTVLMGMFGAFHGMWKAQTKDKTAWKELYDSIEEYYASHGRADLIRHEIGPNRHSDRLPNQTRHGNSAQDAPRRHDLEGSGMIGRKDHTEVTEGKPDPSTGKSGKRGLFSRIGMGILTGMGRTSETIVGTVVPSLLGSTITGSAKAFVAIEDAVYEAQVIGVEGWVHRHAGKSGRAKDRLEAAKSRKQAIIDRRAAQVKVSTSILVSAAATDEEDVPM